MRVELAAICLGATMAIAPAVSAPNAKAAPTQKVDADSVVLKFDVAGMKLGMSPAEIRAALARAGFSTKATDPDQDDWEARITQAVAKRRQIKPSSGKVPMFTMASGPRGEHIEVWYYAGPEGARAGSISFSMSADHITTEAFRKAAAAKYGEPTNRGWGSDMLYCSSGETSCVPWSNKQKAYLHAGSTMEPLKIYLTYGVDSSAKARADFDAEVERRAPKDAPATF